MNANNLKNIGIIMGGYSHEYEISLKSGMVVYNTLKEYYNCYRILIKENSWTLIDENDNLKKIDKETFEVDDHPNLVFDCIFNAIHGTPGEDGKMHKYFSHKNIPITGCNSYQSELTFDKVKCLNFLSSKGIKVAPSITISKTNKPNLNEIEEKVGFPCFVKASNSGSSFGVYKVYNSDEIKNCLVSALEVDNKVLVESHIDGREFSIGVISFNGEKKVLPITEIITSNDFFDYEAKYEGKAKEITPAKISTELESKLNLLSKDIYELLELRGFSRSEFIVNTSGIYYLETNTVPGLTSESILPQQAKCANIDLKDLFINAIEEVIN